MLEDENGNFHFRNLTVHQVTNEEEALNLLFLGDTNRAIGETEMNKVSSRSHCIFSIIVEGRKSGGDTVVRSKLNLVDLAGSERVHKTNSEGQTLREAQYINTSLFFLEMVKTIMVATISSEEKQTGESISTCHFAQRVALVKNTVYINEELEPMLVIRRLKEEIKRLKEEVRFLKGENTEESEVTVDQFEELKKLIKTFVQESGAMELNIGTITLEKIKATYSIFKEMVLQTTAVETLSLDTNVDNAKVQTTQQQNHVKTLRRKLEQRDREIKILIQ
eukprot:CAMPEP_0184874534 /NCGR_PEP_ID=MMETSP0580-20130426/42453_1 /TAXON_ID=1118495 /ORGANISM="Dactyliosolen fragilissimus" /LENGTH=277 /DNA_ID=CAMNT_0027377567 /DNA_START=656 /DNA_END=1486 /DNA_ORIENTATION=-